MSHPGEATAADELLLALLSDDVRQALRRLAASGVLYEALDVSDEEDGPNGCDCACNVPDPDAYDETDMLAAYLQGHADALKLAAKTVVEMTLDGCEADAAMRAAGVL